MRLTTAHRLTVSASLWVVLMGVVINAAANTLFTATPPHSTFSAAATTTKKATAGSTVTTQTTVPLPSSTSTTTTPRQPLTPSVTNLTLAADIEQRLDRLDKALHALQQQNLDTRIKLLTQQLADLRMLVEVEGQELLAVNQQLQHLQTEMSAPTAKPPSQSPLPIGNHAASSVVKPSHHQVMDADSMASIKASAAYHSAVNLAREKKYSQAIPALQQFVTAYPHSGDAASAYYWLGNLQAIAGNSAQSQAAYLTIVKNYRQSLRRPDALLKLAQIAKAHGDLDSAQKWLGTVIVDYPNSHSAIVAKQQLQTIT